MYSNFCTLMLSAIVTKITGRSLNDFLNEYLYSVIGIEKPQWNQVHNISFGATGLQISANDMARFGLLLLNDGNWDGTQVVSKEYLDLATNVRIETQSIEFQYDYDKYGYGYQFWMNSFGDFRCAGAWQQYIIINKEYNLVFVIKSYEERDVLSLFENYVLKAAKTGWNYCDYSLRDYTRRFKINSQEIIEKEKEIRFG
ncbi:MAG: serine hydrolase, partial [Bacilli bacterium]|nr:serine hydrolase [Bacilli bacterium]